MKSCMKKCMGSIIYVPGCDGSNNNTSKKQAQKRPKQPKIDLTRGGGGIIMAAVRLIVGCQPFTSQTHEALKWARMAGLNLHRSHALDQA